MSEALMANIKVELPGVVLGVLEANEIRVEPAGPKLVRLMDNVSEAIRHKFSLETLAESETSRSVRAMFRGWGIDPSKYRPSSEALLRRVVQGKGLYRVSNAVDIGNLGSIESGWPFGLYDSTRMVPPITFRHGSVGEMYENIGKRMWHLEGRPVLADALGPLGSPISDSTRTIVTRSTNAVLAVIYAPEAAPEPWVRNSLSLLTERLMRFAASGAIRSTFLANANL